MKTCFISALIAYVLFLTACISDKPMKPVIVKPSNFPDQMIVVDGKGYLLVQRGIGSERGDSVGLIRILNTTNDSLLKTIRLHYSNPSSIVKAGGFLYIACTGKYIAGDGAIEMLDPAMDSTTVLLRESELDPYCKAIMQLETKNDSVLYVAAYIEYGNTPVWAINITHPGVIKRLSSVTDAFGGITYSRADQKLFVGERGFGIECVKIFDDTEVLVTSLFLALPPYSMGVYDVTSMSRKLVVTGVDANFTSGRVMAVNCTDNSVDNAFNLSVNQDSYVRITGNRIFIMERSSASNLIELNGSGSLLSQKHLGNDVNPVDVDSAGPGKYYVVLQNIDSVLNIQ